MYRNVRNIKWEEEKREEKKKEETSEGKKRYRDTIIKENKIRRIYWNYLFTGERSGGVNIKRSTVKRGERDERRERRGPSKRRWV